MHPTATSTKLRPEQLPAEIGDYLRAHRARDVDTALRAFTATAVVVDDGTTYRGTDEIRRFLSRAGAQFSYTTTLVAAERLGDAGWSATLRLEGNFPGGVVDLRYRFTMDGGHIAGLVIAP
jgi:ketosteroid isomerase-like protein